jgi:transcriptional regulator with XRE-family HTH domain
MTAQIEEGYSWAPKRAYKATEQSIALGTRLKQLRKSRKLTQGALAEQIGKTRMTVVEYERGNINPPIAMVHKLAEVLGEAPEYIAFGVRRAKEEESHSRPILRIEVSIPGLVTQT